MDEKTELVGTRFPEEVVAWLRGEAKARNWNLSRTVRWAVQETMKREPKGTGGPSKIQDFRALL